ncbi:MAG: hypothetical protein ACOCV2_01190 [Persicimonas sp.]
MMDLERIDRRLLWVGLFAAAALLVWLVVPKDKDDSPEQTREALGLDAPPLESWKGDETEGVSVHLTDDGPALAVDDGEPITLTPSSSALEFDDWEMHETESHTYVVGDGDYDGAPARAVWTFADGNPQAHFGLSLTDVPAKHLSDDAMLDLTLPEGDSETAAPLEAMPDEVSTAVRWRGGDHLLTFDNWTGEMLAPLPGDSEDATVLGFVLWSEEAGKAWSVCEEETEATFDARAAFTVTLGGHTPVARWPQPEGQQGRMVPVFGDPSEHEDAELHEGATDDPDRWVDRARTLVHGHSNPEEPRYGNGGLLGNNLGGTIIVPSDLADKEAVHRFAESLEGSSVELLAESNAELPQSGVRLSDDPSCDDLLEAASESTSVLLEARDESGVEVSAPAFSSRARLAPLVAPRAFDGQLKTLVDQGFGRAQRLFDERGTIVFQTPFVATRNPLIGAAKEALLHPERHGQWTLSTPLSDTLADMEIWREEMPVEVTSLSEAARYVDGARSAWWGWDDEGNLLIGHAGEETITDFTIALPGRVAGRVDGEPIESRPVTSDAGEATLLWWDLEPGKTRVELSGVDYEADDLRPVDWSFERPD